MRSIVSTSSSTLWRCSVGSPDAKAFATQNLFLHAMQRRPDSIDLGEDVHAIAVVFDHAQQAPHLSLDALQSC